MYIASITNDNQTEINVGKFLTKSLNNQLIMETSTPVQGSYKNLKMEKSVSGQA